MAVYIFIILFIRFCCIYNITGQKISLLTRAAFIWSKKGKKCNIVKIINILIAVFYFIYFKM